MGEKVCDIPRFLRVSNNCGISYNDPRTDSKIKELLANLPDGNYVATFDYQWYRGGWASGSNWYGEAIFKSESR